MTKLYNVESGLEESLPLDQIPTAIQSGTHGYKKGTRVNILDESGKSYSLDAEELPQAFEEGYKLESPDQIAVREYVKENEGFKGALKVGGLAALNQIGLGAPEIYLDKTQDPLEVAKRNALKDEQDLANIAGNVAGLGVSLFAGAPVFKGIEAISKGATKALSAKVAAVTGKELGEEATKSVARNAAEKAAEYGIEGTILSTPVAITEAMLGDPGAAAETLVMGGVLGGALGGTVGALKPLAKLGREKLDFVTNAKKLETDSAYNIIGATPAARAKMPQDVEDKLPEFLKNIAKEDSSILKDPERLLDKVADIEQSSGKILSSTIDKVDDRLQTLAKDSPDLAQTLKPEMFDYDNMILKIEDEFVKKYQNSPGYTAQINEVNNFLKSVKELVVDGIHKGDPTPIDLKNLRKFQIETNASIDWVKDGKLLNQAKKTIWEDIQDYYKTKVGPSIKELFPDLAAVSNEFKAASDQVRVAKGIEKTLLSSATKQASRPAVSFGDIALGTIGASQGIEGAVTGLLAQRGKNFINKNFDTAGLLYAEQVMKKTAKALDEIPKKLKSIEKPVKAQLVIGLSGTNNNKEDNYESISEKVVDASMFPEKLESFYADTVDVIADQGAPQIAEATKVQTAEAIAYLANLVPKPLVPQNPLVKSKGFKPSAMEKNKFMRQVKAALDPLSIVDDVVNGSVTKDQLQVVADLYPDIYFRIQNKVIEAVQENPAEIPYNKRLKLSLLLNMDLDPSISPELAPILINIQPMESEPKQSPSNNINFTSYPTDTQRIAMK